VLAFPIVQRLLFFEHEDIGDFLVEFGFEVLQVLLNLKVFILVEIIHEVVIDAPKQRIGELYLVFLQTQEYALVHL
jgi:hypothetical protein